MSSFSSSSSACVNSSSRRKRREEALLHTLREAAAQKYPSCSPYVAPLFAQSSDWTYESASGSMQSATTKNYEGRLSSSDVHAYRSCMQSVITQNNGSTSLSSASQYALASRLPSFPGGRDIIRNDSCSQQTIEPESSFLNIEMPGTWGSCPSNHGEDREAYSSPSGVSVDGISESEELISPPIPAIPTGTETRYRDDYPVHPTSRRSNSIRYRHHPYQTQGPTHSTQVAGLSSRAQIVYTWDSWNDHARAVVRGGERMYQCVFRVGHVGTDKDQCGYIAQRSSVKRHIESRHLLYKPYLCPLCPAAFSQKANLDTHLNHHTGARPHECPYDGCDKKYGDPARKHRHMVKVHKYKPQGARRNVNSYHDIE